MSGNAVKTIVLMMILVVVSVLIGVQVSDGMKESFGAFALIASIVGFFALVYLGKNAWWLIFFLPPILNLLQVRILTGALGTYAVAGLILAYNLVQSLGLRQVKLRWHAAPFVDAVYAVILLYMAVSYYRFPVMLDVMGDDVEYVGGETYVHCVASLIYFLCLNSLDVKSAELEKVIRWAFWVSVIFAAGNVIVRYATGNVYWGGGTADDMDGGMGVGEQRITLFSGLVYLLLPYLYASAPFFSILLSPWRMAGILFSLFGLSLAGSRGMLVAQALGTIGISLFKKEFGIILVLATVTWVGCIALGAGGGLGAAPKTMQRMLSILPGVQVSRDVAKDAQGSSDVRVAAWKMAFDTRAGYIRDYVWGDGYQLAKAELQRGAVASMRGTAATIGLGPGNDTLARLGQWHNGFITTMHRLGLVGCALLYTMMFIGVGLYMRLGFYYRGTPFLPYFCASYAYAFTYPFAYSYNAGVVLFVFDHLKVIFVMKLLYTLLREEGKLKPMAFRQRAYVPMLIRELSTTELGSKGENRA